jgi:hypothetical protein
MEKYMDRWMPEVRLLTATFHENITDKAEAQRRLKPIADYLLRRGVVLLVIWQQQKRGAWHAHILVNRYVDIVGLRQFAVARGWGNQINIVRVGEGRSVENTINYLCRYLTRDFCGQIPLRVRLVGGSKENSVGTVKFSWVEGLSRAWRVGAELWSAAYKWAPRTESERAEAFYFGLKVLGYLDFETITTGANPYG